MRSSPRVYTRFDKMEAKSVEELGDWLKGNGLPAGVVETFQGMVN